MASSSNRLLSILQMMIIAVEYHWLTLTGSTLRHRISLGGVAGGVGKEHFFFIFTVICEKTNSNLIYDRKAFLCCLFLA